MDTIDDLGELRGRRVLIRSDLNVPLDDGRITDDGRIKASAPTIRRLADAGARVVVCAHLGRPKGKPDPAYSLRTVAERLGEVLEAPVAFAGDTVGPEAKAAVEGLGDGGVALLENLRFDARETSKDDDDRATFADELASLAELYVSDGFGAVHRKHASVYDVPKRLPHAAGDLVVAEVEVLKRLTDSPERPYVVVLGGSKVSDKLGVIDNLISTVDRLIIGGGMVFTFLKAHGHEVGRSLLEEDQVGTVRGYVERARSKGVEIVLPVDVVVATAVEADAEHEIVAVDEIPADRVGVDIGPGSSQLFAEKIEDARTVFWNGPMGVFELAPFAKGTRAVASAVHHVDGLTVIGGGDSAAAIRQLGFTDSDFGHVSTGGGASLEYLEGKTLPGLDALED